jgi:hypothetical protein
MRLTIGLAAMASLCLLAGCNKGAANNSANAPAANVAAANVAAPAAPAETAAPANGTAAAGGADRRTSEIAECVSGAPGHLPVGTDANAFCSCAVDKMITNSTPQSEAVNQCATEMHITLPAQQ